MDNSTYNLTIDGKEITLSFRARCLRHIKEITDKEPFAMVMDDGIDPYEKSFAIFYGGALCKNPSLKLEEIKELFDALKLPQITEIITAFGKAFVDDEVTADAPRG